MSAASPWPPAFEFHGRRHPSANSIVLRTATEAVLVDAGFVGAYAVTDRIVRAEMAAGRTLSQVLLTHWHSDHSGGAGVLQSDYGVPVRAHRAEADLINARDPRACDAEWLQHPIAPFCVQDPLEDGTEIAVGDLRLVTVHVPGQTPGHVAFYDEQSGVLVAGDMVQRDDVAWLPPLDTSLSAVHAAISSLERLLRLEPRIVLPGHGPPMTQPKRAIEAALHRYERWLQEPELAAWHALNRLCVAALMIDPLPTHASHAELARRPWLPDYAAVLDREPVSLARDLLGRLQTVGAIARDGDALRAAVPFDPPAPAAGTPLAPAQWPPC